MKWYRSFYYVDYDSRVLGVNQSHHDIKGYNQYFPDVKYNERHEWNIFTTALVNLLGFFLISGMTHTVKYFRVSITTLTPCWKPAKKQ